ncbi:MAG: sulfurtransferase [Gammaproteobacteria bacterium]
MTAVNLPLLLQPDELASCLGADNLLIVDLSLPGHYAEGHVPGAIRLDYPSILYTHGATDCDIPPGDVFSKALSQIGFTKNHHVIAYDRQSNPMACRLLWTLAEFGHTKHSLLDGGWHAWCDGNLPAEQTINTPEPSHYYGARKGIALAKKRYILERLNDPDVIMLDTRMNEEFTNELIMTDRGGKIPGAVHFDWMDAIDEDNSHRIRKPEDISPILQEMGVVPEKEIITYCQTHLRSAHTYFVLKLLGYQRVLGYAAGYSEWGNDLETPIENEQEAT